MGKVQQYIDKLSRWTPEAQKPELLKIIIKNKASFIDLNTAQLMKGTDSEGEFLQHYRSKAYAALKLHLNPAGVTDLYLTGSFQHHFFLRATNFPVTVWSNDEKTKDLVDKYGPNIFGLTQHSKETFREFCRSDVAGFYRKIYKS